MFHKKKGTEFLSLIGDIIKLIMAEELQKVHLYYDDINKIRVIETNVLKETEDLKDTCKDYDTSAYLFYFNIQNCTIILAQLF